MSATTKALESTALLLMQDHLNHCVADAVAEGGDVADAKLKEAGDAIEEAAEETEEDVQKLKDSATDH